MHDIKAQTYHYGWVFKNSGYITKQLKLVIQVWEDSALMWRPLNPDEMSLVGRKVQELNEVIRRCWDDETQEYIASRLPELLQNLIPPRSLEHQSI